MKNRSGNVELVRFIVSLIIMTSHIGHMDFENYPFISGWVFVEFFLFITGYYTAKHFDGKNGNNFIKSSIIYTYNKFIRFIPYTITVIVLLYVTSGIINMIYNNWSIRNFIFSFSENFIFDILLLTNFYLQPNVGPLWYLSAMFIVFPIFSCIMQIKNRYLILLLSFICSGIYYFNENFCVCEGVKSLIRVFIGLLLGAFIYECLYVFEYYINKMNKLLITIIEVLLFSFVIYLTYNNSQNYKIIILCFVICITAMMSGKSYTSNINCNILYYLGKLSLPVYIIHWFMVKLIHVFGKNLSNINKLVLYYSVTIIVAIIFMYLVDHWKWFQNLIKKPIVLKD